MPARIELLKQAGFSDAEIGDWATAERKRMNEQGFTDDEIDEEFGVTRPPKEVPEAFIERLKQGNAAQRIAGAVGDYAHRYFGDEPLGFSPRNEEFLRKLGAAGDIIIPAAKPVDAVLRAVPAGIAAVGAGFGQALEEAGDATFGPGPQGAKGKAARDFASLAQIAALLSGADRAGPALVRAPEPNVTAAPAIVLPRAEDFRNAAAVISGTPASFSTEQKLLQLWKEHGISPVEVAQEKPATELTGNPDFGKKLGFLASLWGPSRSGELAGPAKVSGASALPMRTVGDLAEAVRGGRLTPAEAAQFAHDKGWDVPPWWLERAADERNVAGPQGAVPPQASLQQFPEMLEVTKRSPELAALLEGRPKVRKSLADSPDAIEGLQRSLARIESEGADAVITKGPGEIARPDLKPEELEAINHLEGLADANSGKRRPVQPDWDQNWAQMPGFTQGYIAHLYRQAEAADRELGPLTGRIADLTEGKAGSRPDPKDPIRLVEKVRESGRDPSKLVDFSASKIVYGSIDQLYNALGTIERALGDKVVRVKNRLSEPTLSGYGDILMNLKMSNGHIAELRLIPKHVDAVAAEIEHPLYQVTRSFDDVAKVRPLTTEENAIKIAIQQRTRELYRDAFAAARK